MIVGTRISGTNAYAVGTSTTVYNMITIPTGKTFVMTDLVVTGSYAGDEITTFGSNDIFKVYDFVGSGATAASGTGTARVSLNLNIDQTASYDGATIDGVRGTTVLHFTNGPEFSNGVTPGMGAANTKLIGTGCVWVAGLLR